MIFPKMFWHHKNTQIFFSFFTKILVHISNYSIYNPSLHAHNNVISFVSVVFWRNSPCAFFWSWNLSFYECNEYYMLHIFTKKKKWQQCLIKKNMNSREKEYVVHVKCTFLYPIRIPDVTQRNTSRYMDCMYIVFRMYLHRYIYITFFIQPLY